MTGDTARLDQADGPLSVHPMAVAQHQPGSGQSEYSRREQQHQSRSRHPAAPSPRSMRAVSARGAGLPASAPHTTVPAQRSAASALSGLDELADSAVGTAGSGSAEPVKQNR